MRHRARGRRTAAWLAVLPWLAGASCGPPPPPEGGGGAPAPIGVLHAPREILADFSIDHRITIRWQGQEQSFRAVLEKRGDTLTIVGLGPHGGRGFVLRQEGLEVSWESHLPEALPFPPEHILMAVWRTWLSGLPDAPLPDGEHRTSRDGEEIVERWEGGLLRARSFRRLDDAPPGRFEIDYGSGLDPAPGGASPARIEVRDGWIGLEIVLEAIARSPLE